MRQRLQRITLRRACDVIIEQMFRTSTRRHAHALSNPRKVSQSMRPAVHSFVFSSLRITDSTLYTFPGTIVGCGIFLRYLVIQALSQPFYIDSYTFVLSKVCLPISITRCSNTSTDDLNILQCKLLLFSSKLIYRAAENCTAILADSS